MTKEEIERYEELDRLHQEQYEFETMWKEHNFMADGPPKRKFPWLPIVIAAVGICVVIAIVTLPAVARRVHEPYVAAPRPPTITELAQQTCASHGQSLVSWKASAIGTKEVFCRTGDSIELSQRFIRAD